MKNILKMLQKHKIRVAIVAAVVLLLSASAIYLLYPKNVANQTSVHASAGQKIVVTVSAKSVSDMYGYQFRVNYDKNKFEYKGALKSEVSAISTIFAKPFDGYQQIGATMVGKQEGISGKNMVISKMEFTALKDGSVKSSEFGISKTGVVSTNLKFNDNVSGWSCKVETSPK